MSRIAVQLQGRDWKAHWPECRRDAQRAARAALKRAGAGSAQLTIRLAGDAEVHALNRQFRQQDKPTNVLSFPAGEEGYLGDVIVAFETVLQESLAQGKTLPRHGAHLIVHGVLHLLHYDHDTEERAAQMEALEVQALADCGVPNPYHQDWLF